MQNTEISGGRDSSKEPPESQAAQPDLVLVVEDNVTTRKHATEMMIRSSYEVRRDPDASAVWEALKATHYDLLIQRARMKLTPVIVIAVGGQDVPIIKRHLC